MSCILSLTYFSSSFPESYIPFLPSAEEKQMCVLSKIRLHAIRGRSICQ